MFTTMSSKTPDSCIGRVIVSPCLMFLCTLSSASPTTRLVVASRMIASASRIGTPAPSSVPKVRAKRATMVFFISGPLTGMRSCRRCMRRRNA